MLAQEVRKSANRILKKSIQVARECIDFLWCRPWFVIFIFFILFFSVRLIVWLACWQFSHSLICLIHVTAYFQAAHALFFSFYCANFDLYRAGIFDSFIDFRMPFLIAHLPNVSKRASDRTDQINGIDQFTNYRVCAHTTRAKCESIGFLYAEIPPKIEITPLLKMYLILCIY